MDVILTINETQIMYSFDSYNQYHCSVTGSSVTYSFFSPKKLLRYWPKKMVLLFNGGTISLNIERQIHTLLDANQAKKNVAVCPN